MNFKHLLSLDRRYTKTESEIFRRKRGYSIRVVVLQFRYEPKYML